MKISDDLKKSNDFDSVFNLVKESVETVLGMRRPGLMLALQRMPDHIGAYYPVDTNVIVLNKSLLAKVFAANGKETTRAYVFYVLLHEYLHSLGYLDENEVHRLSHYICRMILGDKHLSTQIAKNGIGSVIPSEYMQMRPPENQQDIEIVEHFDSSETTYIG